MRLEKTYIKSIMSKFLFLDFDGVLNDHSALRNGCSQLNENCILELCRILDSCKDVNIILSTAWRYMTIGINPAVNYKGMEYILCLFGANQDSIQDRIVGATESDEETCWRLGIGEGLDYEWLKENGISLRKEQILFKAKNNQFVVLDDLELDMPQLIKTDPGVGLTKELADLVIERFNHP